MNSISGGRAREVNIKDALVKGSSAVTVGDFTKRVTNLSEDVPKRPR
ncbi:hypothetical protein OOU_Y34scaffold00285g6 [Pyricularia oryzae Y34]|uniref:Uncharacterized protein n=3 Tax=Pyricularia oryzae TaxID=318829 RepID=Q2KEW5_PYRO7|nr:hypothetical protein MGCH7_ch7g921 [Pyricularia oryzae 70-15]ELQ41299.1 hypothetical protein OOU_Y34scaffold00285g6 [Pyricularia oryzae Y34]